MKIISVGTLKGGTGKTTITFNIGGALAEKHKVLLIDMDPQCNLSGACGINVADRNHYSSRDIFRDDIDDNRPELLVVKSPIRRCLIWTSYPATC